MLSNLISPQNLSRTGIFLALTGLLFSRAALSLGMFLLLLATLTGYPLRHTLRKFIRQPDLVLLTSLFFLYFFTGIYSDDKAYFWQRMRIAMPLFFMPFAFSQNHIKNGRELYRWLYFFFLLMVGTALYSMTMTIYRQHSIGVSEHLTTPINHVRYSLLLAFSIFIGLHLYIRNWFKLRFEQGMVLAAVLFQIVCLHYLAVRSGLIGFYVVLGFGFAKYAPRFRRKMKYRLAAVAFPFLLLCSQLPSFQHELKTTQYSILAYCQGKPINDPSDQGRIASIEAGIQIGLENFWTGVGLGDIKNEMQIKYAELGYGENNPVPLPRNQFVFCFAFSGIFGLVWFGLVWL